MNNYSFQNLCAWTSNHEIVCPMSPAYIIKPVRQIMKGKFGGLTRVTFRNLFEGAYQMIETKGACTPDTGLDTLLYKAIYTNGVSVVFLVDHGTSIECIAEMTRVNGKESKITIIDPERDKKYFLTLDEDEFFAMFERAVGEIKIKQKDESYNPAVAISL